MINNTIKIFQIHKLHTLKFLSTHKTPSTQHLKSKLQSSIHQLTKFKSSITPDPSYFNPVNWKYTHLNNLIKISKNIQNKTLTLIFSTDAPQFLKINKPQKLKLGQRGISSLQNKKSICTFPIYAYLQKKNKKQCLYIEFINLNYQFVALKIGICKGWEKHYLEGKLQSENILSYIEQQINSVNEQFGMFFLQQFQEFNLCRQLSIRIQGIKAYTKLEYDLNWLEKLKNEL